MIFQFYTVVNGSPKKSPFDNYNNVTYILWYLISLITY